MMNDQSWRGELEPSIAIFPQGHSDLQWCGYNLCVFKHDWELVISLDGD